MVEFTTRCGAKFIVDDDIAQIVKRYSWGLDKDGYVIRNTEVAGKYITIRLHRFVMNASKEFFVDHANQNKLDNRKENLRLADVSTNAMNLRKTANTSSRHKGVTWNKSSGKWQAQIQVNGKRTYLGMFDS